MMKYIIVSSYLNNVSILQDGRHSEPLFEKWLSVNKFSKMAKFHQIIFVFIQIFVHANLLHKSWSISSP